jgi:hypothetical protein
LARSTSLACSSVWPQTDSVLNEKKKAHELNNAAILGTELIARAPLPQIRSGTKLREYRKQ